MRYDLTLTDALLQELASLLRPDPRRAALCPAMLSKRGRHRELLAATAHWPRRRGGTPLWEADAQVLAVGADRVERIADALDQALAGGGAGRHVAALALGVGEATGYAAAAIATPAGRREIDRITVVGPGLPRLERTPQAPDPSAELRARVWSRTAGALGATTWERLTGLRFAVVGCGRSGSLVAEDLVRLGVRSVTVIDPDRLEPHNVGETALVTLADVGKPKVKAVAAALRAAAPVREGGEVTALAAPALAPDAVAAVKRADVVFACVDNNRARLAVAALAALYLKPLLDIATGVRGVEHGAAAREVGADVRLLLPGSACPLCFGGIGALEPAEEDDDETGLGWRRERLGSLRSLNTFACALAERTLEELVAGRVRQSLLLRADWNRSGAPTIRHLIAPRRPALFQLRTVGCLCALAAGGDTELARVRDALTVR